MQNLHLTPVCKSEVMTNFYIYIYIVLSADLGRLVEYNKNACKCWKTLHVNSGPAFKEQKGSGEELILKAGRCAERGYGSNELIPLML